MTISGIDESQRKAARVAGFTCLFTTATMVFANFGIHERLIVAGNAAETARNIMAHERLFRISIACDLIYCAGLDIPRDRKSTRLNSSHRTISYAVFCLKKKISTYKRLH